MAHTPVMRRLVLFLALSISDASSIYDLEAEDLQTGLPVPLSYYRGKVMLIVNVASQCGYTDSTYRYLNKLHAQYASRGLAIIAFPCNSFGGQEPGSPDEIFNFGTRKGAKFDFMRKVEVNGQNAHPVFKWLLGESGDCADQEASCAAWAASGECDNNPTFMSSSCKLSCKLCTPSAAGDGQPIRWNFESFLISRSGEKVARWLTGTDITQPQATAQIEALLNAKDEI